MTEPLFVADSRRCNKCCEIKPLDQFNKAPRGKYGRTAECKACKAAYHAATYVRKGRNHKRREAHSGTELKTCSSCKQEKLLSEFSLARKESETRNAVYRSNCKRCQSDRAMQWFRDNRERNMANKRRFNLEKLYGLTPEEYDDLVALQGGVCAICGLPPPGRNSRDRLLVVDHCHATGVNRGLLCMRCNRAIGLLADDTMILENAITYLRRQQAVI